MSEIVIMANKLGLLIFILSLSAIKDPNVVNLASVGLLVGAGMFLFPIENKK